ESLSGGEAARPTSPAEQRGESWAEEGAVLVVVIESRAAGDGEPWRDGHVVLHEHAGRDVRVREAGGVLGAVRVAFGGSSDDPGVAAGRPAQCDFAEEEFVLVTLADFPELVLVLLG